jgi:hypothetical protein
MDCMSRARPAHTEQTGNYGTTLMKMMTNV